MDFLPVKRFELSSSPNTHIIADLIRLVLHDSGLAAHCDDTVLSDPAELKTFVGGLQHGPYLPLLVDNDAQLEFNQPLAIIQYICYAASQTSSEAAPAAGGAGGAAAGGAAAGGSSSGLAAASPSVSHGVMDLEKSLQPGQNSLRAVYVTEAVIRFIKESFPPFVQLPEEQFKKKTAESLRMVAAMLAQQSALDSSPSPCITFGELAAFYYAQLAVETCGADILSSHPKLSGLAALHAVLAKKNAIGRFLASRKPAAHAGTKAVAAPVAPVAGGAAAGLTAAPAKQAAAVAAGPGAGFAPAAGGAGAAVSSSGASAGATKGPVLLTGAAGFVGSWICKALLEAGYIVHGTVRSLEKKERYAHLLSLPGAGPEEGGRLKLFEADLLKEGSYAEAVKGCTGIFHCASPFSLKVVEDPEEAYMRPAVQGTRTIMQAAFATASVKRIVLTSSMASVYMAERRGDHFTTEEDWSDQDFLQKNKMQYAESKLRAEQEAWNMLKDECPADRKGKLTMVVMNPALVMGPLLQTVPTADEVNQSAEPIYKLLTGAMNPIPNASKAFVDVRDVALAHLLAFEKPSAEGRYVLVSASLPWRVVADMCRKTIPGAKVPPASALVEGPAPYPQATVSVKKTFELGVHYLPIEDSIRDTCLSLLAKGLLKDVLGSVSEKDGVYAG